MATERATKSITTAGGYTVKYKSYITGDEYNAIEEVQMAGMNVSVVGNEAKIDSFKPSIDADTTKKLIDVAVVSVEGDTVEATKPVLQQVLDLPYEDYAEVVAALKEISGKKKAAN